jgi:hypothetical protein
MNNLFANLLISSPNGGGLFLASASGLYKVDDLNITGIFAGENIFLRALQPNQLQAFRTDSGFMLDIAGNFYDIHDVLWADGFCYLVATDYNEIIRLNAEGLEDHRWTFPGENDSWHINCLGKWGGRIIFSAFGEFKEHRGYKSKTSEAGFVKDLISGEILIKNLSQPHSLCENGNNLIIANSERKEIIEFFEDGRICRRKQLNGYTRGLAIKDDVLYVGLSCSRNIQSDDIDTATVVALNVKTFEEIGRLSIPSREIYDIRYVFDATQLLEIVVHIGRSSSLVLHSMVAERDKMVEELRGKVDELSEWGRILQNAVSAHETQLADFNQALNIKQFVLKSIDERKDISHNVTPSQYWTDFARNFRYVYDLSDVELQRIRYHTFHLTSDFYLTYYFASEGFKDLMVRGYQYFVETYNLHPVEEGANGVGVETQFGRISHDLLRYLGVAADLFDSNLLDKSSPRTIVEFGGGYGGLARICLTQNPLVSYFICDLEETLFFSYVYLSAQLGQERVHLVTDSIHRHDVMPGHAYIVPQSKMEHMENIQFHFAVSQQSLQEMSKAQVERYLTWASVHAEKIYSCNIVDHGQIANLKGLVTDLPFVLCQYFSKPVWLGVMPAPEGFFGDNHLPRAVYKCR